MVRGTENRRSENLPAENRWQAVLARDSNQDGNFVFAVSSTGVYCRPSCPSRRPRRENVTFFHKPDDAEKAGYRACRRCHPKAIGGKKQAERVKDVCRDNESNLEERVTMSRQGAEVRRRTDQLQRSCKEGQGQWHRAEDERRRRNQRKRKRADREEGLVCGGLSKMRLGGVRACRCTAAGRYAPQWKEALEQAMLKCVAEAQKLAGKTIVLVDVSGSMTAPLSHRSEVLRTEQKSRVHSALAPLKPISAKRLLLRNEGLSFRPLAGALALTPVSVGTLRSSASAGCGRSARACSGGGG